jgi:hypothetical protein
MLTPWFIIACKGIIKILIAIFLGTAIGTIFECRNGSKYIAFLTRPLLKFSRLPAICGTAFITAFVSNIAASGMLVGAYSDQKITRKDMIISALLNSFPAYAKIMLLVMFFLIPMIGKTAIIYCVMVISLDLIRILTIIAIVRICYSTQVHPDYDFTQIQIQTYTWHKTFDKAQKRSLKILRKFIIWGIPLYLLATFLAHIGVFNTINEHIPHFFTQILPSEVISIIIAKLVSFTAAATVAMGMLQVYAITIPQVLIAFFIGNLFDIPIRTITHNLPIALGIFPEKSGLWIVLISESTRMITCITAIIILFAYI